MKDLFHRRYSILTALMFLVLGIFSLIPINCSFLDPLAKAIGDFDVYDIVYSKLRDEQKVDTNIVLVNVSNLSRSDISRQVNIINSLNPKVIAIDAIFQEEKEHYSDSLLTDAFARCKNLVLVNKLDKYNEMTDTYDTLINSTAIYNKYASTGFANFPNDDKVSFRTIREFRPFSKAIGKQIPAFASKIVELYNPKVLQVLNKRANEIEKINYIGNYNKFYYLDQNQVLSGESDLSFLKDKIVLMGFMGLSLDNKTFEDIYFTPLNERYAGKTFPDMYGVVIHANIISMILQENYIYIMPGWLSLVLAVIICYLSSFIIFKLRQNYKDWFFTFSKLYILLISLLNLFIGVILLHNCNYRINLTLTLAVIVLSGTIVDIYKTYLSKIFPSLEK
jgi:CHASE2 domain-containing sensor protein